MPQKNTIFDKELNELEIAVIGIGAILVLETIALFKEIDGTMFGSAMAGIGAVIGWVFKGYRSNKKKK